MQALTLEAVLGVLNLLFASANLILVFSLFVYILSQSLRNSVARAFAALMGFMAVVFAGDVVLATLTQEQLRSAASYWLKFQWLGIAFVPATFLHLSDALLRTTNASSRWRRLAVIAGYLTAALIFLAAISTPLILGPVTAYAPWAIQFTAGPFFWFFSTYFFITAGWGFANVFWAQNRTLTRASRRRIQYLTWSSVAPFMAVYPYMLIASRPLSLAPRSILILSLVGNLVVATITVVMAYSVAFLGALAPDRVVKHSFVTYLLRGPLLGAFVLGIAITVPRVEHILGMPRDTFLVFAIVGGIIAYQIILRALRPLIDWLVYRDDRTEVNVLRALEERLLTPSDLRQLMENVLASLCDLLRARNGLLLVWRDGQPAVEAACGDASKAPQLLAELDALALEDAHPLDGMESWPQRAGFRLHALQNEQGNGLLGVLAIEMPEPLPSLTERERSLVQQLISQAEIALEDRRLQQSIFAILRQLAPEMESIQRWRSEVPYPGTTTQAEPVEDNPIFTPDFSTLVKEALSHYWGGPRLSESPLLKLAIVRRKLAEHDNNPARALRAVLSDALDALRPEGERSMTTQEWLLYNILDLKYIEGKRAKDVAMRLAMSESDLYRKQRAAIDELARALQAMERELAERQNQSQDGETGLGD
jgi:hypothetical protein